MNSTLVTTTVAGLLYVLAGQNTVLAQDASSYPPLPKLEGTWEKTDGQVLFWNKKLNRFSEHYHISVIEIENQRDATFEAYQTRKVKENGHAGKQGSESMAQSERLPMLGAIGWNGTTVIFADIGDTTSYQCELTDLDTMQCMTIETGEFSLAGRMILTRQAEQNQ